MSSALRSSTARTALLAVATFAIAFGAIWLFDAAAPVPSLERCRQLGVLHQRGYEARCYSENVDRLARSGPAGVSRIDAASVHDRWLLSRCHNDMHVHGRRAGRALTSAGDARQLMDSLPARPATCAAGYVHGVIEGYLSTADSDAVVAQRLLCSRPRQRFDRSVCDHGLGHALLLRALGGARDRYDVERVLTQVHAVQPQCAQLAAPARYDCTAALQMSLVEGPTFQGGPMVTEVSSPSEGSAFCREQGAARWLCLRYLPFVVAYEARHIDLKDVLAACRRERGIERTACAVGVGRVSVDPAALARRCTDISTRRDLQRSCWYGSYVAELVNDRMSARQVQDRCRASRGARAEGCAIALGRWAGMEGPTWRSPCARLGSGSRVRTCERASRMLGGIALDGDPNEVRILNAWS